MTGEIGGVLLLSSDPNVVRIVETALTNYPRFHPLMACRDMLDLATRLENQTPLAAIVDVDRQPDRILADLADMGERFVETRLVLLAESPTSELLLEAMQIGARHVLSKANISSQIVSVLGKVVGNLVPHATASGRLYTVLSAGGGCGATTVAINLATEMQMREPQHPALLIDLDATMGGASMALGVRAEYGIADVLNYEGPSDPQLVRSTVAVRSKDLHVLVSPPAVDFLSPAPLAYENLGRAMAGCRMAYRTTVVDAPRIPLPAAVNLAAASHGVLIVLQANVRDIRVARQLRHTLLQRNVPNEHIRLVINRYNRRYSPIALDDVQRALGVCDTELIANDFGAASNSLNLGRPLAETAPSSAARKDILRLAEKLVHEHAEQSA